MLIQIICLSNINTNVLSHLVPDKLWPIVNLIGRDYVMRLLSQITIFNKNFEIFKSGKSSNHKQTKLEEICMIRS